MAQAAFMDMGALAFANRAASELRATGAKRAPISTASSLTPQEREIAQLAASGLSNKEIGVRLLLSSRTVGTHLYRVFPKLGVHSRAGLRDALIRRSGGLAAVEVLFMVWWKRFTWLHRLLHSKRLLSAQRSAPISLRIPGRVARGLVQPLHRRPLRPERPGRT